MESKEIFKDIPSFEGLYQVSNYGNVKSCKRVYPNGRIKEEKIMKQVTIKKGYRRISLYRNGKNNSFLVHRLVAMAFIPNPNNLPCIDHKNCNTSDNRVENLRWCTDRENVHFCMEQGRRFFTAADASICSRMVAKLDLEGKELEVYPSIGEAHRNNPKASISKISAVCRGERKTSGGFKWEFRSELPVCFRGKDMKKLGVSIPICRYDSNMNLIDEFKSISEAYTKTNIHETCIRKSLNNGYMTEEGYFFKYKKKNVFSQKI